MTRRRAWRGACAALGLIPLAFFIPGSPVYLPTLFDSSGTYDGHTARYWARALDSSDQELRLRAIAAIGAMNEEAADSVPAISEIMVNDPSPMTRAAASHALSKMMPAARSQVAAFAKALEDAELHVRMNAAMALFRLRDDARPAVPTLIRALKDQNNQTNLDLFPLSIQEMMVLALGRASTGTSEAIPALLETMTADAPNSLRIAVCRAFGEIGAEARTTAPHLRSMLKANSLELRRTAQMSLRAIGLDAPSNEQMLRDLQTEPELPESDRKYLWEIEHHGNLLVKHGFIHISAALKNADEAALTRLLSDGFVATDLREPRRVQTTTNGMQVERLEDAGYPALPLPRPAFVAKLLGLRSLFGKSKPTVKCALMTLSPKVRGKLDGIWESTVQMRVLGEHAPGAPAEVVVVIRFDLAQPSEEMLSRAGWLRAATIQQVLTAKAPHFLFAE